MAGLKIFTDGASRGNPGEAGVGVIIYDELDRVLLELGEYIGITTNNVAEYQGLIKALKEARNLEAEEVEVFADSELMVKQIKGEYQVKNEGLQPLYREAKGLIAGLKSFKISHVLRGKNKEADRLANAGIDNKGKVEKRPGLQENTPAPSSTVLSEVGDFPELEVKPGIIRKILALGSQMMAVEFKFKKGALVPLHNHDHEQISYIVKGKIRFTIAGKEVIVSAGESIAIPAKVEHSAEALEKTLELDVFCPIREDFL